MRAHNWLLACSLRPALLAVLLAGSLAAQQSSVPSPPGQNSSQNQNAVPSSPAQPSAPQTPFGEITGIVKAGTTPLPGVTVSAANTLTGKKYATSTDVDGSYRIEVGSKGRYVVRAEFSAFAPVTQEVMINPENHSGKADLTMMLLSRVQQEEEQQQPGSPTRAGFARDGVEQQRAQQPARAGGRNGLQQLSLSGGDLMGSPGANIDISSLASSGLPNAGLAAEGGTESVAVSGAMGRNEMPMFDPGEMQDRIADMRDQMARQGGAGGGQIISFGGGPEGFGGGPMVFMMGGGGPSGSNAFFLGGGGGRGMRNFDVNKPHGSIFYAFNGSPLDAKPFSLSGAPEEKASYDQSRFGATIGGPLNIPHIYHGGSKTFFFFNYTGTHGNSPYDVFSTVPTQAERSGNFSGSSVQLVDPVTHIPFANNQLPSINPAAAAVLPFIPLPNLPGTSNNFHFVSSAPTSSDSFLVRINHNFGADQGMFGMPRRMVRQQQRQQQQNGGKDEKKEKSKWSQSINGGLSFNRGSNDLLNPFPALGGQLNTHNYNANAGYTAVKGLFLNSLRFNYNRSNTNTANHFTDVSNIESQLGINGVSQLPNDFGLPNLTFAPEFSSLQDTSPQFRVTQNFTFSDSMSLTHGKHGFTWGGDYRHQLIDVSNAPNARGSFVFTGDATGLAFADFLLGFPQQTSVQFGGDNYHFRANSFDVFGQDNWRALKNFTLNLGLRYEYVSPVTELNGKLTNLDVAPGFTAVAPVLPGQVGPLTGIHYPASLINPDRNNFAPRVGVAWKPFSKTVVRTGYSINYNLGQYGSMATQLGFQPPFAFTETNTAPVPTALTLQNGFPASAAAVTNNYAVDPNYRLAYVQSWNLNIQQEVKGDLVINIGYTGAKGTHLDEVRAPSLDSNSLLNNAQPFLFESSDGSSILHSGSIRVRKRMRHGLSFGGTYTYSRSIDNASSIGGTAVVVAQNDLDLAAERGLSSFDQRHRFTADYYYQLPFGKEKKWLHGDHWQDKLFGGFGFQGSITLASGFPFSLRIFGSLTDLSRGANGSLRPDLVPGQSIMVSDPGIQEWFNTAAFVAPPKGHFGDAGRNIIEGPGTIDFDMAFSKTVQVKEMQSLELRLSATNVFNHPNFTGIDTTLGSPTFGQVVSVGSMRKTQLTARYRF